MHAWPANAHRCSQLVARLTSECSLKENMLRLARGSSFVACKLLLRMGTFITKPGSNQPCRFLRRTRRGCQDVLVNNPCPIVDVARMLVHLS